MDKLLEEKQEFNSCLGELSKAIKAKEDAKIAEVLETAVIPFLSDLKEAVK